VVSGGVSGCRLLSRQTLSMAEADVKGERGEEAPAAEAEWRGGNWQWRKQRKREEEKSPTPHYVCSNALTPNCLRSMSKYYYICIIESHIYI